MTLNTFSRAKLLALLKEKINRANLINDLAEVLKVEQSGNYVKKKIWRSVNERIYDLLSDKYKESINISVENLKIYLRNRYCENFVKTLES